MIRVQAEDFDIGAELKRLSAGRLGVGGLATFTGLVREQVEGGQLVAMTLEHYPGMTERMLQKIEEEARRRWPLDDCLIIHRIGRLMPGDQIVLVACSSAHRQAALEACAFLIDWLKTDAPFWKKEELNDQSRWVEAKTSDDAARGRWQKSGKV